MGNNSFTIVSLFYSVILLISFFTKRSIKNTDTRLFKGIIIANFFNIVFALTFAIVIKYFPDYKILNEVFAKIVVFCFYIFSFLFNMFVISVTSNENEKNVLTKKVLFIVLFTIFALPIFILPIHCYNENKVIYTYGPSVTYEYAVISIMIIYWVIILLMNLKTLKKRKCIPILSFVALLAIVAVIQKIRPELLLLTSLETIISYILFHTIENPDLRLIEQLNVAKMQAEKANRAKTDFLSSMSHEIRTPLNAIVGLSEDNLTYQDKCPPEVIENSHDIVSASQTLLEIVGNILDINKIEANKMELVNNPYNFVQEITQMCKVTETRIGDKPIKLNISFAPDIPYELNGDKGKVKEIINNILSNAIKYTDQGEINLSFKCINDIEKNDCILITTCQDTGKGIKAEQIGRLFDKFDRLDAERNTTTEGTGLGLAITKRLVGMMGGKINVQSQYGKGSIFIIQIHQQISKMTGSNETTDYATPRLDSDTNYGHKRILVVDDNKLNIKVAKKALSSFNFEIDECYDGEECLNKIKSGETYDLILMDIMMPNMNGEVCFTKLKEFPGFNTPVIALTADAIAGSQEKYMSEGFNDYIAKPFNKDQINEKLSKIFNN